MERSILFCRFGRNTRRAPTLKKPLWCWNVWRPEGLIAGVARLVELIKKIKETERLLSDKSAIENDY